MWPSHHVCVCLCVPGRKARVVSDTQGEGERQPDSCQTYRKDDGQDHRRVEESKGAEAD